MTKFEDGFKMKLHKKSALFLAGLAIASAGAAAFGQTPLREVSGAGAQAQAQGVNGAGVLMDVQVLFNASAPGSEGKNGEPGAVAVLLKETSGGFESKSFGSIPSKCLKYWLSADGTLHLTAKVTLAGTGSTDSSETHEAVLNLSWNTKTPAESISEQSSSTQGTHQMTETLSGASQRTTVSGSVTIDCFSVPLIESGASFWASTSNKRLDQVCDPSSQLRDSADGKTASLEPSAASDGYWTGYWTWDAGTSSWYWTWVWVWTNGSGASAS
jgi:hypothetical protein